MRGLELSALYLLVGLGVTIAASLQARTSGWLDAGLLFAFWPLYGPFLVAGRPQPAQPSALLMADGIPARLEGLSAKVSALDQVLAQPDFHLPAAEARKAEHEAKGETRASARVQARIESILRLQERRAQLHENLAEARELMAQLRVQTELMRVSGGSEVDTSALVLELESRVQGLDGLLEDPYGGLLPQGSPQAAAPASPPV